jgi:hypothetical protein
MPFQKHRYPPDWREISLRIREREGWKCKFCGAENGKPNPLTGSKVVLTVAHLGADIAPGIKGDKHDKWDCRDVNLAALCQRCHLRYDIDEHTENARKTREAKTRAAHQSAGQKELNL